MLQYQFESYVRRVDGAMNPHGIPIPCEISDPLWEAGLKRLIVKINGYELRRGLQGSKEKGSHIVVGRDLLTEAGVGTEDKVRVEIAPDPNPEEIEVPDELLLALEQDDPANDRWMSLAPGKKRSIAYHVSSAKREDTRIKRVLDIANKLRTGTLHGD